MADLNLPSATQGTLDRLDTHQAVILFDPDREITCPVELLPAGSQVGDSLFVTIATDDQHQSITLAQKKALMDHLLTGQ